MSDFEVLLGDEPEADNAAFLRDLASRLMHVPVSFGTDGGDIDRLNRIAREIEKDKAK